MLERNPQTITIKTDSKRSPITITHKKQISIIAASAHYTIPKTFYRIKDDFIWKGRRTNINSYTSSCKECQLLKRNKETRAPMVKIDTFSRPYEKVYLDIVGPLTKSRNHFTPILTLEESLTSYMHCIQILNVSSNAVSKIFFEAIICQHGIPEKALLDQGSNSLSDVLKNFFKL